MDPVSIDRGSGLRQPSPTDLRKVPVHTCLVEQDVPSPRRRNNKESDRERYGAPQESPCFSKAAYRLAIASSVPKRYRLAPGTQPPELQVRQIPPFQIPFAGNWRKLRRPLRPGRRATERETPLGIHDRRRSSASVQARLAANRLCGLCVRYRVANQSRWRNREPSFQKKS